MIRSLLYPLVASIYIVFVFITSAFFFLIAFAIRLVTYPFDRRLRCLHQFTCFWASLYIWLFPPWSVSITGREKIDINGTYVIVSNHQSLVDILVAFTLFIHFKWVSKAELFHIPFIGWNMRLNRYVRLKRQHKRSIKKMYDACEKHLRQGSSIFLFPEGTRSLTGELRNFKEGAFVLATRLGIPVLPLVINGSKDALPKNSFNFHGKTLVSIDVLDPVPVEKLMQMTSQELAHYVRNLIDHKLKEKIGTENDSPAADPLVPGQPPSEAG